MQTFQKARNASRRGIALVVVLALLAMLVIMSVSFVVFMRAERTASRDYAEFVKARNVAEAGVTRALIRIQQIMNQSNQFFYGGAFYSAGSGQSCTNWASAEFAFLDHYIPVYGTINTVLNDARNLGRCRWTNMTYRTIAGNNALAGRYSYIVMDASHFLDMNTIGSVTPRASGVVPGEVAMPPDDIQSAANLIAMRQQHPFETLCEANLRNRTAPSFNSINQYQPRHLVTFSYYPNDAYFTNNTQQGRLYISTNSVRTYVADIKTACGKLGFDTAFADNLVDFSETATDTPYDGNCNRMGGGKLVPMLYELVATNGLRKIQWAGKDAWELETRIFYETWFPFPVTANRQYSIRLPTAPRVQITATAPTLPATTPWTLVTNGWRTTATTITTVPNPIQTPTNSFGSNVYVIVWRTLSTNAMVQVNSTLTLPQSAFVVSGPAGAGPNVDQATFAVAPIPFVAQPGRPVTPVGWGVCDPRINWRVTDWRKHTVTTFAAMIGRTNEFCDVVGNRFDKDLDSNGDGSTFMYTRRPGIDKAGLDGIGDLGYLLYHPDKPWHTVRLTRPRNAPKDNSPAVFDMLSILPTNRIYRGFVNPNSQDAGALQCAFLNASKARYRGEAGAATIDTTQATRLANLLINKGVRSGKGNAYTNISDVCRLTGMFSGSEIQGATGESDFWKQKAVMRNSIGLMNPRQNYWIILVCAQATKDVNNNGAYDVGTDFVTGEVQCIAFVWRDPYEDPSDTAHPAGQRRHKMFVQFFKWL